MTTPYDASDHTKTTFAYFGRAFYAANVFESGLQIAIMLLEFFAEQEAKIRKEGRQSFSREVYEAEFDAFFARQFAQSLGNLIKRAQSLAAMPDDLKARISRVKERRDFLAHHFFRERAIDFASRAGKDRMIEELEHDHDLFCEADRDLSEFLSPIRRRWGLTEERLERAYKEMLAENDLGDD